MNTEHSLRLKKLNINTYREAVLYVRKDCPVCRSEGFEIQARVNVTLNGHSIIATLNTIDSNLLAMDEASLSCSAWQHLQAHENDVIQLAHPQHLESQDIIRKKIDGERLNQRDMNLIIHDLVSGALSDIYIAAFLTAGADDKLNQDEIYYLTKAMINAGDHLSWGSDFVVDKHCVGGLPGNRTSIIVVPIVTAFGLLMPKTSSRAITSPSGTADTMEALAPVDLDLSAMRKVVEKEKGCVVWGGSVDLSPADDLFIRIEKALNLDGNGQLIASVLSKKIAAGSTHIVIDIPIGPTAKVTSLEKAEHLKKDFDEMSKRFDVTLKVVFSDGTQPVGRGIGPALEARDVLSVLKCTPDAPQDLREHALTLAGHVLEFSSDVPAGTGKKLATEILNSGRAFSKFKAICEAQGGMREPPIANFQQIIFAQKSGIVTLINNQFIATLAKLAGAPNSKSAGVELLTPIGSIVTEKQPLYIIHSETQSELLYAMNYVNQGRNIIEINEQAL